MTASTSPASIQRPLSVSQLSQRGQNAPEQPIARLMGLALANPKAISLAAGFVDNHTLPVEIVQSVTQHMLADPAHAQAALQYGTNTGNPGLRRRIAARYFQANVDQLADEMILTAGSNQFLHLATECLCDPGDIVICAAPTYFVYLYVLRDVGVRAYGVGIDEQGLQPSRLEEALANLAEQGDLSRVKGLYVVPYFDNPAGTNMSATRRREIIDVFNRWVERGAPMTMLVDNAYRDLRYDGEDVPSMIDLGADPTRTVETGTFSKNLSPGIRVGWGIAPAPLHQAIERRKSLVDFGSPHFNQMLVSGILASGQFDEHITLLQSTYRQKRDAMLAACDAHLKPLSGVRYESPRGGLYVWLEVPDSVNAGPNGSLWKTALDAGVLYVPGEFSYPSEGHPVAHNTMRLSFGVQSESRIADGIAILAQVISEQLS